MTTLSKTRNPTETRERDVRWAEWEARATATDARLRRRIRVAWATLGVAILVTALLLL